MDKHITKGLNIIIGEFKNSTTSNGDRVKSIINAINSLTEKQHPKLIIPLQYGYDSIEHHIKCDDPGTIIILNVDTTNNKISENTSKLLNDVTRLVRDANLDTIVVICFDADFNNDLIARDKIYELSDIYDKPMTIKTIK